MTRKVWFQLVDEEGNVVTSIDFVDVADEAIVVDLRDAVFVSVSDALPATVIASDLTVFASRAAYDAEKALEEDSPIGSLGGSENTALIVQVPDEDEDSWDSRLATMWSFLYVAAFVLLCMSKALGQDPSVKEGPIVARVVGGLFYVLHFILLVVALGEVGMAVKSWIKNSLN